MFGRAVECNGQLMAFAGRGISHARFGIDTHAHRVKAVYDEVLWNRQCCVESSRMPQRTE